MGAQKAPIQKNYEINVGHDSLDIDIDFSGENRQLDWIELSLVYDKSNKRNSIYDSYNVEMASKKNKISKTYKLYLNIQFYQQKKHDIDNLTQKHLFYKQFVV